MDQKDRLFVTSVTKPVNKAELGLRQMVQNSAVKCKVKLPLSTSTTSTCMNLMAFQHLNSRPLFCPVVTVTLSVIFR